MHIYLCYASNDGDIATIFNNLLHNGLMIPKNDFTFVPNPTANPILLEELHAGNNRKDLGRVNVVFCFISKAYLSKNCSTMDYGCGWAKGRCIFLPFLIPPLSIDDLKIPPFQIPIWILDTKSCEWIDNIPKIIGLVALTAWHKARKQFFECLKEAIERRIPRQQNSILESSRETSSQNLSSACINRESTINKKHHDWNSSIYFYLCYTTEDIEIVTIFRDLLCNGLKIPENNFFFKSNPSTNPILQEECHPENNREDRGRKNIVVCFISEEYLSKNCSTMDYGRGWAKGRCIFLPFLIPPLSVEELEIPVTNMQIQTFDESYGWINDIFKIIEKNALKSPEWTNACKEFNPKLKKILKDIMKRKPMKPFVSPEGDQSKQESPETPKPPLIVESPEEDQGEQKPVETPKLSPLNNDNKTFMLDKKLNIPLKMIYVRAGNFKMGNDKAKIKTSHQVTLTEDYWIGKFVVTQKQYEIVTGNKPSFFPKGDAYPVEQVSWINAQSFCEKLNTIFASELPNGYLFRLPTEAEWEYAARGGQKTRHFKYSGSNKIKEVACYQKQLNSKAMPVGNKKPNELGIFGMSGNVWEWCLDCCDWNNDAGIVTDTYYDYAVNPLCSTGEYRVVRGGSYLRTIQECEVSFRSCNYPGRVRCDLGFRVVLALPADELNLLGQTGQVLYRENHKK